MIYLVVFLAWTLMLYALHRITHRTRILNKFHSQHHSFINVSIAKKAPQSWKYNNLFLYNDNIPSTIDLWITEVIPTIIFCAITTHWWLFAFYYIWAAFIQEQIEHNPKVDIPILLSGKKHLFHHNNYRCNYGLFFPIWDILFNTYKGK